MAKLMTLKDAPTDLLETLLRDFADSSAQAYWQQDQGVGKAVDNAEGDYVASTDRLVRYLRKRINVSKSRQNRVNTSS